MLGGRGRMAWVEGWVEGGAMSGELWCTGEIVGRRREGCVGACLTG